METTLLFLSISGIFFIYLYFKFTATKTSYRLPPSPKLRLPIIGHLHLLSPPPPAHRTLQRLAKKLGPIFSLKFGFRLVVVVSSPELVEECFTKNDVVLANRPRVMFNEYVGYNHTTMFDANYGDHWRSLRRINAEELLSSTRLNAISGVRQDEIKRLLLSLYEISAKGFSKVGLGPKLSELTFNAIMRMVAGKRYFAEDEQSEQGYRARELIKQLFEAANASNPEHFLPFLLWVDYRGLKKKMAALGKNLDDFFQSLVDEHRVEKRDTMIAHLLSMQESQPDTISDQIIKGIIMNTIVAGTDTSAITIEWAMSVLLNHPDALQKVKDELYAQVGQKRLINEEDLPSLPYLRGILWETLRLFPPGPLLIPHESSVDCKVGGYDIPRGTMLLINAWAIHRDPKAWDDPTSFKPERFVGKEIEKHKLLPFGMGRRACPGISLGLRMVGLALGSLIQCFEWERMGLEQVDLDEGIGMSMPKLKPLEVMCKPREIMHKVALEAYEMS